MGHGEIAQYLFHKRGWGKLIQMAKGNVAFSIVVLILGAVVLFVARKIKMTNWNPEIRYIAGLDAIEEAVGRATEMGRPVHFSPGVHDITAETAPQTFAGISVLSYVAGLCCKYGAQLICTIMRPNVYPLAAETVRQAYVQAGKPEMFTEETVRYLGNHDQAYAFGVYGIMRRERPGANIMMGGFDGTAVGLAESGAAAGAMQVAGTAQLPQIPFFVASCDYTLIGEELYAAGAFLSKDRDKAGGIVAQDWIKAAVIAVVLLGVTMATLGSNVIGNFLSR